MNVISPVFHRMAKTSPRVEIALAEAMARHARKEGHRNRLPPAAIRFSDEEAKIIRIICAGAEQKLEPGQIAWLAGIPVEAMNRLATRASIRLPGRRSARC